ncbi:ANTAR domain-containing protein [Pseudonocardiaceae bacterium YIM PH 21723]|nr:ANTAR domain-containing protein [Pseudonocardiaceae bacterium YIM PH 21723]
MTSVASHVRLDEATTALEDLQTVLDVEPLSAVLDQFADSVLTAIADADMVTVTVWSEGGPETVAATDSRLADVDAARYTTGAGPGLAVAADRRPVRVTVSEAEERWPAFAEAARAVGVGAHLSAPLVAEDEICGMLNLYGVSEDAFDPFDESLLRVLSMSAAFAIGHSRRYQRCRTLTGDLEKALVSRAEIDQAKGALMAVHAVSAPEAFQLLVTQSQRSNVKLVNVARALLTSLSRAR